MKDCPYFTNSNNQTPEKYTPHIAEIITEDTSITLEEANKQIKNIIGKLNAKEQEEMFTLLDKEGF